MTIAITLGDPAGIGAEVVFAALRGLDVPVYVFGSRALANPPAGMPFVDIGGGGAVRYGTIDAEYGRVALASIEPDCIRTR